MKSRICIWSVLIITIGVVAETSGQRIGYLRELALDYTDKTEPKPVKVKYTVSVVSKNGYLAKANNDQSLLAGNLELKVDGVIKHLIDDGTEKVTTLSGILLNDDRDVLQSWLYSTNCHLKPTDMSKILPTLKKPLRTGVGEGTPLPNPIWLFRIHTNYLIKLQP